MRASYLLLAGAVVLLGAAIVGAVMASGIANGSGMPPSLWIAYGVGSVLSILVGSGLFILLFHSSRHGYDDIERPEDEAEARFHDK